jgi:uncharacterized protein
MKCMLIAAAVLLLLCTSCEEDAETVQGFDSTSILELREEKNLSFRNDDSSPIPAQQRPTFVTLRYYPPKEEYVVDAVFVNNVKADTVVLQTSTGSSRQMVRAGTLTFALQGKQLTLQAFRQVHQGEATSLFVPFTDKTSGSITYSAGRYMDVPFVPGTSEYVLDFNMAYNPYCAYNSQYSCPLVPSSNRLPVSIEAGEKVWH